MYLYLHLLFVLVNSILHIMESRTTDRLAVEFVKKQKLRMMSKQSLTINQTTLRTVTPGTRGVYCKTIFSTAICAMSKRRPFCHIPTYTYIYLGETLHTNQDDSKYFSMFYSYLCKYKIHYFVHTTYIDGSLLELFYCNLFYKWILNLSVMCTLRDVKPYTYIQKVYFSPHVKIILKYIISFYKSNFYEIFTIQR